MGARRRPELDESDVRVRPNPRGTRPRSKDRPRHSGATPGWVIAVDRGRYTCLLADPHDAAGADARHVVAMTARELGRAGVVIGDLVALVGDTTGRQGSLARIVRVEPRRTELRRSVDDRGEEYERSDRPPDPRLERVVVANADQLAVVTALADPVPRPRMVDRCLVAAYDAGMSTLLVLTKADLADAATFVAAYAPLDVAWVVTRREVTPEGRMIVGLDDVREALRGRVTLLVGHSGVGKSTLVNALVPGAARAVGRVNEVTGRGRHTSTSALALPLPGGGWVIDTPGVRSFGLAHVDPDRILHAFPDLAAGTGECPRGCTHDETDCALDVFVSGGGAGPAGAVRLASLRRLLRSRSGEGEGVALPTHE